MRDQAMTIKHTPLRWFWRFKRVYRSVYFGLYDSQLSKLAKWGCMGCLVILLPLTCQALANKPVARAAQVKQVALQVTPSHRAAVWYYQIHLALSKPSLLHAFLLPQPARYVLDLAYHPLLHGQQSFSLASPIADLHYANHDRRALRLVFQLRPGLKPLTWHVSCHKSGVAACLLTVDTSLTKRSEQVATSYTPSRSVVLPTLPRLGSSPHALKQPVSRHAPRVVAQPCLQSRAHKSRGRDLVVVVDPGHGGIDPGATGRDRTHEKDVVLQIAKKLAKAINQQPGFHADLTRRGDYYLKLRERLAIARHYHADMFIAIHADAFKNSRAHGVSVFALSSRGATSEAARWLAAKENQSELVGGVSLNNKSQVLRSVLINLSQNATIDSSIHVGDQIIRQVSSFSHMHQAHVEQAAFVVLKSPDIPSLLVEVGFISNPKEETRLKNHRHQQVIAAAIAHGIFNYFKQHPPQGTKLKLHMLAQSAA